MTQTSLDFTPRDTHVLNPAEQLRLAGQNLRVLERLMKGRATARELSDIALNYRARVSDLRRALQPIGKTVRCEDDETTGASFYELTDIAVRAAVQSMEGQ